ncbi:MAG: AzlC family ABC transporter permease [Anaerolineae bacterium]
MDLHRSLLAPTPQAVFAAGFKAQLPVLLGVVPFAMIFGVTAVNLGLPTIQAMGMSVIVFAGAAQLVALQLISTGAPLLVILTSTFFINLRFLMYGASLAPHLKAASPSRKGWLAYLLTDQAYAISIAHFTENPDAPHKQFFYLGAGVALAVTWQISTAVGIFLGAQVPASWSLDFAVPLTFLALVFPALKDWPAALAAVSAGVTAVFAANLPYNMGLIIAALTGILIGYLAESRQK